jgi:hypothetical protein
MRRRRGGRGRHEPVSGRRDRRHGKDRLGKEHPLRDPRAPARMRHRRRGLPRARGPRRSAREGSPSEALRRGDRGRSREDPPSEARGGCLRSSGSAEGPQRHRAPLDRRARAGAPGRLAGGGPGWYRAAGRRLVARLEARAPVRRGRRGGLRAFAGDRAARRPRHRRGGGAPPPRRAEERRGARARGRLDRGELGRPRESRMGSGTPVASRRRWRRPASGIAPRRRASASNA